MDGRVFHVLKRLDENIVNELLEKGLVHETRNFAINLPKTSIPISFSKKQTPRLLGKRIDFDNFLQQKVVQSEYCQLIQGELINDYHYDENKIVFEGKDLEIEADLGIVSCGFQSGLLKKRKSEKE